MTIQLRFSCSRSPAQLGWAWATPAGPRLWLLLPAFAAAALLVAGAEAVLPHHRVLGHAWSALVVVLGLVGAVVAGGAPPFVLSVAPLLAGLLAWQGVTAAVLRGRAPPVSAAVVGGALLAWPLALSFPVTARPLRPGCPLRYRRRHGSGAAVTTTPTTPTPAATPTSAATVLAPLRSTLRWAATHGLARAATGREARAGNLDAQLLKDPALQADPWPVYERMREQHPFARGGFSKLTVHHDACLAVLRSEAFGVAVAPPEDLPRPLRLLMRLAGPVQHPGPIDPPAMLAVDPPDHTRYRRLVSRAFTARAVAALRERTTSIATGLLDDLAREGGDDPVDLVERYAGLLPVTVICEMLGIPDDMRAQFLVWGDRSAATLDMGLELRRYREVEQSLGAINTWMRGHLRRLRRDPGEDLLSRLVAVVDEDGTVLTEDELLATAVLVLGAGFETTVNLIGNGTAQLLAHPEQRALLADDPALWPDAADEVLRFDSPVQRTARRALRDTEVLGRPVRSGELVVTVLAAANRDPRVFTDPHSFRVARAEAREHVAFSSGIHYCLGAALARMEGEVALRSLFERFPDLRAAGEPERRPLRTLRGYARMPVRLGDPA